VRVAPPSLLLVAALVLVASPAMLEVGWAERARVAWEEPYVNVRAAPGLDAAKVGRLARGAEGEVLSEEGEWVHIRYPGGEGWVVDRSLQRLPEPAEVLGSAVASPSPAPPRAEVADNLVAANGASETTPPQVPTPSAAASEPRTSEPLPGGAPNPPREGYLSGLDQAKPPPVEPGAGLVSMLSGLLLVLALLAGAVWLGRRFLGHRFPGGRRGNTIRVLATRALGPRQGLLLAEAGGLVWLLAQGPDGVRLVAEIRDEAALQRLNEQFGFRDTPFEAQLRQQMDLEENAEGPRPDREPSPEERLAALRRRPKAGEPS